MKPSSTPEGAAARHIERRSIDWIPHEERHGRVADLGT
jgi:hypothetical protein